MILTDDQINKISSSMERNFLKNVNDGNGELMLHEKKLD